MRCSSVAIPVRRSDLTGPVDRPDVDAELQRRGGDERLQPTVRQTASRRRAAFPSTGCRGAPFDGVIAQPIAQMPPAAFSKAPGVDEHQRGAVLAQRVRRGDRCTPCPRSPDITASSDAGHLDRQDSNPAADWTSSTMAQSATPRRRCRRRCRTRNAGPPPRSAPASPTADAQKGRVGDPPAAARRVRARCALRRAPMYGMNLDDDLPCARSGGFPAALGGEQQVQRFGRRDQNMAAGVRSIAGRSDRRRVAGPDGPP